jgi:hypothetical protein
MMASRSKYAEELIFVRINALLDGEALISNTVKAYSVQVIGEFGRMNYE